MEKLTYNDILKIMELLKDKIPGIELRIMPSPMMKQGIVFLLMSPEDMNEIAELFDPIKTLPPLAPPRREMREITLPIQPPKHS